MGSNSRELSFVWRTLRQHGVPDPDLEATTLEVFMAVGRTEASRTQLWAAARRLASTRDRTAFRNRRRRLVLPPRPELDDRKTSRARFEALSRAVKRLRIPQREVFILAEIEGLDPAQIAETLGKRLGRVESRLAAARSLVAGAMADRSSFGGSAQRPEHLDEQSKSDLLVLAERAAPTPALARRMLAAIGRELDESAEPATEDRRASSRLLQAGAATLAVGALLILGAALSERPANADEERSVLEPERDSVDTHVASPHDHPDATDPAHRGDHQPTQTR